MNPDRRQAFRLLAGSRRSDFSQSGNAALQHEGPLAVETTTQSGHSAAALDTGNYLLDTGVSAPILKKIVAVRGQDSKCVFFGLFALPRALALQPAEVVEVVVML